MMYIPVLPCPAPRMTQSDKWKKRPCVMRYFAYRDELRRYVTDVPVPLRIIFVLPMPASWSAKKRAAHLNKPHMSKPDLDNLVKAWCDALLTDDSHVWSIHAKKLWGEHGGIYLKK